MKMKLYSAYKISRALFKTDKVSCQSMAYKVLTDKLAREFLSFAVNNKLITFTEQPFEDEMDFITFKAKLNIEVEKDQLLPSSDTSAFFDWAKEKHPEYLFEFLMIRED